MPPSARQTPPIRGRWRASARRGVQNQQDKAEQKSFCTENSQQHTLIYDPEFGIVNILKYFTINSLKNLKNLALKEDTGRLLQKLIREYAAYHLDASDLKSEKLI